MKKFIIEVFFFVAIVTLLSSFIFGIGETIATKEYGINTEMQIRQSFENALKSNASNWFIGNSRIYRGINPDVLKTKSYNFAHDNDSYNQMYYKLQYLINNNCKIDTLVIGTDYFQFGLFSTTRNYIYDELLGKDYIGDYTDNYLKESFENAKRWYITKQGAVHNSLLKYTMRGFKHPQELPLLKNNGQYIYDTKASKYDFTKRKSVINDIQLSYFKRILSVCRDNRIKAFVVMLPVRDNELKSYTDEYLDSFKKMINENLDIYDYSNCYYDFSNDQEFKDFRKYTDITHLNSKAADEFTMKMWKEISEMQ